MAWGLVKDEQTPVHVQQPLLAGEHRVRGNGQIRGFEVFDGRFRDALQCGRPGRFYRLCNGKGCCRGSRLRRDR